MSHREVLVVFSGLAGMLLAAQDMGQLIAFRAVQGIGGGLMAAYMTTRAAAAGPAGWC